MPAKPRRKVTPEQVIQWMEKTGRGMRAAAEHFAIPLGTVKTWRHRQKRGAEDGGDGGVSESLGVSPGMKPTRRGQEKTAGSGSPRRGVGPDGASGGCNETHPKKQRALELLIAGRTIREAADEVGVNRTTAWTWTHEPKFAEALAESRRVSMAAARAELEGSALSSVVLLLELAADTDVPAAVRLRAACAVLDRVGIVPTTRHELTGVDGGAVAVALSSLDLSGATVEELRETRARIEEFRALKALQKGAGTDGAEA